jgi:hypothetical protein
VPQAASPEDAACAPPRFDGTNLQVSRAGAKHLYEKLYRASGEMENRIKEQQPGSYAVV